MVWNRRLWMRLGAANALCSLIVTLMALRLGDTAAASLLRLGAGLQFMHSMGMAMDHDDTDPLPAIQLPSPVLSQLHAVLGAAMSAGHCMDQAPSLARSGSGALELEPLVHRVPRRRREGRSVKVEGRS